MSYNLKTGDMINRKEIGLLLRKKRLQKGLTQEQLGKLVGVTHATINHIENGIQNFTIDKLIKIAEVLEIPLYEFFVEKPLVPYEDKEPILKFNMPEAELEGIKLFKDPISLGPGSIISEVVPEGYIPIPKEFLPKGYKSDQDRIVAVKGKGISMKPTINDGSIVWIDRLDVIPKEGEIYAFYLMNSNTVTIKRLIKIDRHYMIIDGDNQDKEDRKTEELRDYPMVLDLKEYTEADISPVRGRVIWVLNRLIEKPKKK